MVDHSSIILKHAYAATSQGMFKLLPFLLQTTKEHALKCLCFLQSSLPIHPYDAPETLPCHQQLKSFVYVMKANLMCYELIQVKLL